MNILFVCFHEPLKGLGGIEGVTSILSKEMYFRFSYNCYSLWSKKGFQDLERRYEVKACIYYLFVNDNI